MKPDNQREKKNIRKLFQAIYGVQKGRKIADCAILISQLNQQGITEENLEQYTKLVTQYQTLIQEAGGMEKVMEYNRKICAENGVTEHDFNRYQTIQEEKQKKQQEKEQREAEMASRFAEYGISPDWYTFGKDVHKPVSCDGSFVRWRGSKSRKCAHEEVYDFMLDKLLLYKKQYEFEHGPAPYYISRIKILPAQSGYFKGCIGNGTYQFQQSSFEGSQDEALQKRGYTFHHYDQYMGEYIYWKNSDASVFQHLQITIELKSPGTDKETSGATVKKYTVGLTYSIPEELREVILNYISTRRSELDIEDNSIYEAIIETFTEEKLLQDATEKLNL